MAVIQQLVERIRKDAQFLVDLGLGQTLGEDAWVFGSPNYGRAKYIDLSLFAIIHGDEVGSLEVILALFDSFKSGSIKKDFSVAVALGNVEAACLASGPQRYIEVDMNRGFGRKECIFSEHKRAKFLESILERSRYFIDLHQTIRPCPKPFFIFPFSKAAVSWARILNQDIPLITHWGKPFSTEGMCTDTFVLQSGGVGITVELGQMGFGKDDLNVGIAICQKAIETLSTMSDQEILSMSLPEGDLYTWAEVLSYTEGDVLFEDCDNFRFYKQGEVIGKGLLGEIRSPSAGWMLFAYKQLPWHNRRPSELARILRRLSVSELPS